MPARSPVLQQNLLGLSAVFLSCRVPFPSWQTGDLSVGRSESQRPPASLPASLPAGLRLSAQVPLSCGSHHVWPHVTDLALVPSAGVIATKSLCPKFSCVRVLSGEVQVGGPVRDTSRKPVRHEPPLHKSEGNRICKIKMRR